MSSRLTFTTTLEDIEKCLSFMHSNMFNHTRDGFINNYNYDTFRDMQDINILNGLLIECNGLIDALLNNDEKIILEMKTNGLIKPDLLWITYIILNHGLLYSRDNIICGKLQSNTRIIDLFIDLGLEKELLTLAISGERLRDISRHRRDSYDILEENIFVVKYLVPKYVFPNTLVADEYDYEKQTYTKAFTPLEYWHDYSNETMSISPPFDRETFEKNQDIRIYLEECIDNFNYIIKATLIFQKYYRIARYNPQYKLCRQIINDEYKLIMGL
jgi:hypothetical protein